jgi:hypothetical protein
LASGIGVSMKLIMTLSSSSTLLSATASGVMDVQEFDQMLDDARSYRAAARLAWKAHNRLVAARAAFGVAGDRRA